MVVMKKLHTTTQNYTSNEKCFQLQIPMNFEFIIPDNDSVRLLSQFVEEMYLTCLYDTYSILKENQVTPRQMLKILLYAYLDTKYASRVIETACKRDVNYIYLLEGKPAPDHATIARFCSLHFAPCAKELLTQCTQLLYELGEISGKKFFIDGTKMEANANKYTFVWKRKSTLQKQIEQLSHFLEKAKEYNQKIYRCGKRNSYAKTDPDATFMRMKEDAMKNGQLKPAYNLQHGVDADYVVWLQTLPNPTDTPTLIPFLEDMREQLPFTYQNIVADAGYESEENYSYLKTHGQLAYIKAANYEISKTRKYQNDIANRENMVYEKEKDCYYCSQGKVLKVIGTKARTTATGYVSEKTLYRCEACTNCPVKSSCIKGNHWKIPEKERYKTLDVARKFEEQRAESLERITSKQGILLRINRSIQAEGSFAALKWDRGFKRFLCRGESNVYAECVLLAVSHNIGKLHSKIQSGKTGSYLHCENKVA